MVVVTVELLVTVTVRGGGHVVGPGGRGGGGGTVPVGPTGTVLLERGYGAEIVGYGGKGPVPEIEPVDAKVVERRERTVRAVK